MKRLGSLLLYFYTWRSITVGSAVLGLVFAAFASTAVLQAPQAAFAFALGAYVFLFLIPFLTAPVIFRKIIGSRRLALVPGLPLHAGLALLLHAALAALFLPLSGWLVGIPALEFWLGLRVFVLVSLYTGLLQVALTSRYIIVIFNYGPLALIVAGSFFGPQLLALWMHDTLVAALALITIGVWMAALRRLATQSRFKPAFSGASTDQQHWTAALSTLLRIDQNATANPAGSLLLGYPAGLAQRLLNLSYAMVFTPLLSAAFVQLTDEDGEGPVMGMRIFLLGSFLLTLIVSWLDGEAIARSRLLWLRTAGGRVQVWKCVEQQLWVGHMLKVGVAFTAAVIGAVFSDIALPLLLHFPLVILACSLYESYLNLCARLREWTSLAHAFAMLLSIGAIAAATLYAARFTATNILLLLEGTLLLAGLLFRALAKTAFSRVDWQVLRAALARRPEAVSA